MSTLPLCAVTGRIAGDPLACGDCDPCIFGASKVPEEIKRLFVERDEWADKYAMAMQTIDEIEYGQRDAEDRFNADPHRHE
ncbi:MAG: hypothetical protein KGL35_08925 [Bradyrhizobium sp.]|nr:hypothetical protein [Bradyrhizobium sp.]